MPAHPTSSIPPIVILGAGINGAALARELVLNRLPVWLVERADVAYGTTAYSSRLIHGGLRYLEYGEFDLVRESLEERTRLLRLAPQFVRPLKLAIPVASRFAGVTVSAKRFLGLERAAGTVTSRGLWLVRAGLSLYDHYARDPSLPRHQVARTADYLATHPGPAVNPHHYPWLCTYYDAQIPFPERFTWTLVEDARRAAAEQHTEFRLWTYHRALLKGKELQIVPVDPADPFDDVAAVPDPVASTTPSLIVNATGAWVDHTLQQLNVTAPPLIAGTKGTHFFTTSQALRTQLAGQAIYGEARDGRPVFILPLARGTLVGTTDERYFGPPQEAVASEPELEYLMDLVNHVVADVNLQRDDIDWHYAGVRPLPQSHAASNSAITRRHFWVEVPGGEVPINAVVGGKLTTCRSLAEQATRQILQRLNRPRIADSRQRVLPGGEDYPDSPELVSICQQKLAEKFGYSLDQVEAMWSLCGTQTSAILEQLQSPATHRQTAPPPSRHTAEASSPPDARGEQVGLADTPFPREFVRWVIARESPRTIEDLVERRLMLLYHAPPTAATLCELAQLLAESNRLSPSECEAAVRRCADRLRRHFGLRCGLGEESSR